MARTASSTPPRRVLSARSLSRRLEIGTYGAAALLSLVVATMALQLWRMDLRVPLAYSYDALFGGSMIKSVLENGWYTSQPLLNAPTGQEFFDWKLADNLGPLFTLVLRPFTQDYAVAQNLWFLIGFPLAAIASVWFFRLVGVSRWLSLALGVVVSIAPYHFYRGENHIWLSGYFPVPLLLGVVYLILRGRPIWSRVRDRPDSIFDLPPVVMTSVALVLIALSTSYYAIMGAILIAFAGLVALIGSRSIRGFLGALVAGVVVAVLLAAALIPSTVYGLAHGSNPEAVVRLPSEAEVYALKLTQLVLPMPGHRVESFAALRALYDSTYPLPSENPALGALGALGFLALIVIAIYSVTVGLRGRRGELRTALGSLSGLTVVAFLLGTFGGVGTILSFVSSDLRGWNRISIHILLLSLAALGLLLGPVLRWLRDQVGGGWTGRAMAAALAALLVIIGFYDQTSTATVPQYEAVSERWTSDALFVSDIEADAGDDAMVLQFPYREFPESRAPDGTSVSEYDQIALSLHSHTLRWSSGGVKGRPDTSWFGAVQQLEPEDMLEVAAAIGFAGITVDVDAINVDTRIRHGAIRATLGDPRALSNDGRYEYYSLDTVREEIEADWSASDIEQVAAIAPHPVDVAVRPSGSNYTVPERLGGYHPRITLENDRDESATTRISFEATVTLGTDRLALTLPDGRSVTVVADGSPQEIELDVPPGQSTISIAPADGTEFVRNPQDAGPIDFTSISATDVELAGILDRY